MRAGGARTKTAATEELNVARPNPGRKPRSENRRLTESIPVRFTKTDRVELQREADRLGMSVPELLRHTWYIARAAS
jgi:hypothetical protein